MTKPGAATGPEPAGLQPERTALAHRRTQLVAVAVGALVVREAHGTAEVAVAIAGVVAALVLIGAAGLLRTRELVRRGPSAVAAPATVAAVVAAVVVMQLVSIAIVV